MDCEISRAVSKEMKSVRTTNQMGAEAAQRVPLRAVREFEKALSRTRQKHSFHKKGIFFATVQNGRRAGDYPEITRVGDRSFQTIGRDGCVFPANGHDSLTPTPGSEHKNNEEAHCVCGPPRPIPSSGGPAGSFRGGSSRRCTRPARSSRACSLRIAMHAGARRQSCASRPGCCTGRTRRSCRPRSTSTARAWCRTR